MSTFQTEEDISLVLKDIIGVCFSEKRLATWKDFFFEKESEFKDSSAEFRHSQYDVYCDFMNLIESSMQQKCDEHNITLEDFFELCRSHDSIPAVNVFNTVLTLSTTPETFFDLMRDSAKREYMFNIITSWRSYFSSRK
jgi:hypothetical protein